MDTLCETLHAFLRQSREEVTKYRRETYFRHQPCETAKRTFCSSPASGLTQETDPAHTFFYKIQIFLPTVFEIIKNKGAERARIFTL